MPNDQRPGLSSTGKHDEVVVLRKYLEWVQAKGTERMKALAETVRLQLDRGERVEATAKDSSIRLAVNLGGEIYQNDISYRFDENAMVVIVNVEESAMTYE